MWHIPQLEPLSGGTGGLAFTRGDDEQAMTPQSARRTRVHWGAPSRAMTPQSAQRTRVHRAHRAGQRHLSPPGGLVCIGRIEPGDDTSVRPADSCASGASSWAMTPQSARRTRVQSGASSWAMTPQSARRTRVHRQHRGGNLHFSPPSGLLCIRSQRAGNDTSIRPTDSRALGRPEPGNEAAIRPGDRMQIGLGSTQI